MGFHGIGKYLLEIIYIQRYDNIERFFWCSLELYTETLEGVTLTEAQCILFSENKALINLVDLFFEMTDRNKESYNSNRYSFDFHREWRNNFDFH